MAVKSEQELKKSSAIAIVWDILSLTAACFIGIIGLSLIHISGCRIGFQLDQFANYTICRVIYNKDIIKAFMDDIVRFRNSFIKADLEVLNLLDADVYKRQH